MLHQSSLLSSNTAGSDRPDFSSCSSLHPSALMFACVCDYKLVCGCRGSRRKRTSSCLLCFLLRPSTPQWANPPRVLLVRFRSFCDAFLAVCGFEEHCGESHISCSHHSGQFSWINRDLTRKCKQVDRSESGQENIYCCQWNVRNAGLMKGARWCQPLLLSHE